MGIACILFALAGCVAIFNATFHRAQPLSFVGRQILWLFSAVFLMLAASLRRPAFYRRTLPVWSILAYASLLLVLLCGQTVNGMRGWFAWHGVFVQPSELAKPVYVLILAGMLERLEGKQAEWRGGYLPLLAMFLLWGLPIALQPDFGTLLVYGLTFGTLTWCMGGRIKHLLLTGLALLPALAAACLWRPYLLDRLGAFLNPGAMEHGAGWHVTQFQRTLAAGGALGSSLGKAVWSQTHLPLTYSDSIFASLAEALGFFGVLPLVLLILGWAVYGLHRAAAAADRFSAAAITGMVVMLAGQSLIHLSVNLGLMPPTGIPLPLISYGGSSLLSSLLMVGIVECLARAPRAGSENPAPAG